MNPTNDERARFEAAYPSLKDSVNAMRWKAMDVDQSEKAKEAAWIAWQAARSQSAPAAQGEAVKPDGYQVRKKSAPADAPWGYCSESVYSGRTLGDEYDYRPLYARTTPQPSAPGEPNVAWVDAVESYAAAARVIALHLKRFCDESLPYPEMIADAARKAAVEIERLGAQPSADDARLAGVDKVADAKRYIRDWCPDHVKDYVDSLRVAPPADARDADTKRLDYIASEYLEITPFAMPTPGGDDADVGWRVYEFHQAPPEKRLVAEVFRDNLREAIDAARSAGRAMGGE